MAYRDSILSRLKHRNATCAQFESIFSAYNELVDLVTQLTSQNSRLRRGITGAGDATEAGGAATEALRAELAELYKAKTRNDQQLIDTNNRLVQMERDLSHLTIERDAGLKREQKLREELGVAKDEIIKLHTDRQTLRDENIAMSAAYNGLEAKHRALEVDFINLTQRWMQKQQEVVDKINEDNAAEDLKRRASLAKMVEQAVGRDPQLAVPIGHEVADDFEVCGSIGDILPTRCAMKFEAHDGEVNDVQWSRNGVYFVTGGSDKRLRLYSYDNASLDKRGALTGCNGAVNRVDFNNDNRLVLGASNDFAIRIWSIDDQRQRHSFTGHGDKAVSARFHSGSTQVISGSFDRTLKIWDLRQQRLSRTFFAGSTALDVASSDDASAAAIISGHIDKKARFWDARQEQPSHEMTFAGRVSSLFLTSDRAKLLCLSRDDTLSLIDLRTYRTEHVYSAEQFRCACDTVRAVVSPGMEYVAVGGADGSIFIWNFQTTKLEKVLSHGGHSHGVMSVAWNPRGHCLLSVDRMKTVCIWNSS